MIDRADSSPDADRQDIKRVLPFAAAAVVLFVTNVALRYPGESNPDSAHQYREIVSGVFDDWHPPAMARLWELLGIFGAGTGPMFVFDVAIYWLLFGLFAAGCAWQGRRGLGAVVLVSGLFPPFLMMNINIVKDMAILMMVASVAIGFFVRSGNGRLSGVPLILSVLLLAAGTLVRNNAVFAVTPLALFLLKPEWLRRPVFVGIAAVVIGLLLVPVSSVINRQLLHARDAGAIRSLQLFDLAGIARTSNDLTVFGPASRITTADVDRCYSPVQWDSLGWDHRCGWFIRQMGVSPSFDLMVDNPSDQASLRRLRSLWINAILSHPAAYVKHRLSHFNSATAFAVSWRHTAGEARLKPAGTSLGGRIADAIRYTPLAAPMVVLAFGLGLLLFLSRGTSIPANSRHASMALTLAALLYGTSFLVVGVASDPRYFLLPTISIVIAALLAFPDVGSERFRTSLRTYGLTIGPLFALALVATVAFRVTLTSPAPRLRNEKPVVPERGMATSNAPPAERVTK